MNILQEIFRDNYEQMVYILHPRASVIENVDKMINCGDPSFGGAMYGCTSGWMGTICPPLTDIYRRIAGPSAL